MDPMTIALFVKLIAEVGVPAALQLRALYNENHQQPVTDAMLADLDLLGRYTSTESLAKLGYKIENGALVKIPVA